MDQNILIKRGIKDIKHLSKLDVIIVSVDYNDFLPITLENNIKIFDNITVVTSINDEECQKICQKFNVNCVVTERMYDNGASFNKGKAINEGIKSLLNPNWILLLDADIIVPETFHESFKNNYTNINSLYVCNRIMFKEYESYLDWKYGSGLKGQVSKLNGIGYFQLFNINSNCLQRIIYPETSNNAAGSDISFRNKFTEKVDLKIESIHLGISYQNWNGRKTPEFVSTSENTVQKIKKKYKICSFYFNNKNDSRLKNNFLRFIKQFEGRYENLIVGLIDYGDIDFQLPCETIIIKGDIDNKVWSKEIIINKIIDTIDDVEYLMWIDCDLIYDDLSWLDNIDDVVKDNDFVQLFENINYLNELEEITHCYKSICFKLKSDLKPMNSAKISKFENRSDFKPGGAWLGRFSILKEKKLFEKMYVGGGDVIFLYGINGVNEGFTLTKVKESNEEIYNEAVDWINSFGRYNIGYLKQTTNHLYHGDMNSRNYIGRYKKLSKFSENITIENDSYIHKVDDRYNIIIFTENIGSYDILKPISKYENTKCIAFMDKDVDIDGWEVININNIEEIKNIKNIKLICKYIRTHSKDLLPKHEYSLHIDANMKLLTDPNIILKEILYGDHSLMAFNHYKRKSIYEEAKQCIEWNLDNHKKIINQVNKYKDENISTNELYECGFMLRRNNESTNEFDTIWWNEIKNNSQRDQISFPYALNKSKIKFKKFNDDNRMKSRYLTIETNSQNSTHVGSREFNNNITFIYEDSRKKWGSTKMRGFDISNKLKCDIVPLSKSSEIKYKKIIILKLSNYKKAIELTEYNEVIIDMVDFNEKINDMKIFKNFDYGIFTSKKQLDILNRHFKYPEKCQVINHHWDERFNKINKIKLDKPNICYFGQPEKCFSYKEFDKIDYHTIDWYDFDEKLNLYQNYNVHFGVKPRDEEDKIQPSTKISTAASLECPIIVNRSEQNIEILGEDYPYYCEPSKKSIEDVLSKIEETFNGEEWIKAINILKNVKNLTSLENISKKYLDI